ncbi:D-glycerate dehydrogenase [Paenibacillus sp. J5C_2022]|uniref:2-hydroxyacid dehydrogenase n=1 Tax=Paenibacillus sp. J5C2022 TaxID=2977129 RepID=UPI0021D3C866|nr:D-glycerate dehydrogenase [Paenibacillus sp. J5C2022]MCU6708147.1 D-glycerate dehydrogenase [Paenibacillus sp. J5C2022]
MRPHVFVDRPIPEEAEAYLNEHCTVDIWRGEDTIPREQLHDALAKADGYFTAGRRIDEALLAAAPSLKAVSSMSVGYNHLDIEAMKRHGVVGTHTPYVLDETVADLTFALMLGIARRVAELDRYVREGKWQRGDGENLFGMDVHSRRLGIIGMGRIGEAVARRAALGFGMDVQYYNRSRKLNTEEFLGVKYASLDELLATSDFIVLLTPLTPETKGMIGRREFGLMKHDAYFINVSRGATVDEEALIETLQNGNIAGAGLDVYQQEPLPANSPLTKLDNVLLLPHLGSATTKTRHEMAMVTARDLVSVLQGSAPKYMVPNFK